MRWGGRAGLERRVGTTVTGWPRGGQDELASMGAGWQDQLVGSAMGSGRVVRQASGWDAMGAVVRGAWRQGLFAAGQADMLAAMGTGLKVVRRARMGWLSRAGCRHGEEGGFIRVWRDGRAGGPDWAWGGKAGSRGRQRGGQADHDGCRGRRAHYGRAGSRRRQWTVGTRQGRRAGRDGRGVHGGRGRACVGRGSWAKCRRGGEGDLYVRTLACTHSFFFSNFKYCQLICNL